MEEQSYLLRRSVEFASTTLARSSASYTFHTIEHTKQVVRAARIISRASQLGADQLDTVIIAAWFHDIGYIDGAEGHEERSASIATTMLTRWAAGSRLIKDVSRAILSTKHPQSPRSMTDMVLCDADLSHLGSTKYDAHAARLRDELKAMNGFDFDSEQAWRRLNAEFLKTHRYFTDYGKTILERRKKVNLNKMLRQPHPQILQPNS